MLDFKAKMHQIRFRLGLRPRPPLEELTASVLPRPQAEFNRRIQGVGGMPPLLAAWQLKFNMHEIWSFDWINSPKNY